MRFSKTAGCFYPGEIAYGDLPADIIDVPQEDFEAAMAKALGDTLDVVNGRVVIVPRPAPTLAEVHAGKWEAIKAERDRRADLGVKVGQYWFHSDQKSRTQQLGLVLLGANIPAGLQWKTLPLTPPPPVFVPMTQQLAQAIVSATAASDTAIFTAAEVHRIAVESSTAPQNYDFSTGWPTSIEEEANAAGITFDQSLL